MLLKTEGSSSEAVLEQEEYFSAFLTVLLRWRLWSLTRNRPILDSIYLYWGAKSFANQRAWGGLA